MVTALLAAAQASEFGDFLFFYFDFFFFLLFEGDCLFCWLQLAKQVLKGWLCVIVNRIGLLKV